MATQHSERDASLSQSWQLAVVCTRRDEVRRLIGVAVVISVISAYEPSRVQTTSQRSGTRSKCSARQHAVA